MRRRILLALACLPFCANATLPFKLTLEEMAQQADHILVGRTIGVDMVDAKGRRIVDENALTGPKSGRTIRLHIAVDKVLVTNAGRVPRRLIIPLDSMMHYSLGQVKSVETGRNGPFLIMLKGASFEPILPGIFGRPLSDQAEALQLHAAKRR